MSTNYERLIHNLGRIEPISTEREGNSQIRGLHLVALVMAPGQEDPRRMIDRQIGGVKSPYGGPQGVAFYATVKAASAFLANQRDSSIITSHQIADPRNFLYGGAVVFPEGLTVAVSGYKDARDALAVTRGGLISDLCDEPYAQRVIEIIAQHSSDFDVASEWEALRAIK